jgi:hypothetical protein
MKSISELVLVAFVLLFVIGLGFAGCTALDTALDGMIGAQPAPTPTPDAVIELVQAVENQSEAIVNLSNLAEQQGETISTLTVDAVAQREAKIAEQEQALKEKDQMMVIVAVGCCLVAVLFVSLTRRKA